MTRVRKNGIRRALMTACALTLGTAMALAQGGPGGGGPGGGGPGGGGPGGGGPPSGGEEAVNNLAYPGAMTAGLANATLIWGPPVGGGILGVNFSYGCEIPDGDYPNVSCIGDDGAFLSAANCSTMCGGAAVSRMYWQKVAENDWWAETTPVLPAQEATFVDWGDNLEAVSWKESSVVRVETTPYATLGTPLQGLQMWHVSGRGPDEVWGARTTDSTSPQPYVYSSNYASIYTTTARLDVTKLGSAATCPTTSGGSSGFDPTWSNGSWTGTGAVEVLDTPFTAELNVQGKYVHGYNLMMRRIPMDGISTKLGWWRLTFYTTGGAVQFSPVAVTTPPPVPAPVPPTILAEEEGEAPLYVPVVDSANDITYIDICILSKKAGKKTPPGQSR